MSKVRTQSVIWAENTYNVKIKIWNCPDGGSADGATGSIWIWNGPMTDGNFLSILFHELGHIHCYRNGIWKAYHLNKAKLTKKEKRAAMLTGWKAECWVDGWAAKEMKKHYPRYKYLPSYENEDDKRDLHESFLDLHYK
jgi:hypothetical protein